MSKGVWPVENRAWAESGSGVSKTDPGCRKQVWGVENRSEVSKGVWPVENGAWCVETGCWGSKLGARGLWWAETRSWALKYVAGGLNKC